MQNTNDLQINLTSLMMFWKLQKLHNLPTHIYLNNHSGFSTSEIRKDVF